MSEKISAIAKITKYGVIGGALAGLAYAGWKIYQNFQKNLPPDTDTPFTPIPEGHGEVLQYKTVYVGAWIGWLIPMVNIFDTKSDFINHLKKMRDTFPKELKVIECYCVMSDGYEHYLGVAYQILNFIDDLPETVMDSQLKSDPSYQAKIDKITQSQILDVFRLKPPSIILTDDSLYVPQSFASTQEVYDTNIEIAKARDEVIETITEEIPKESVLAVLKLTQLETPESFIETNPDAEKQVIDEQILINELRALAVEEARLDAIAEAEEQARLDAIAEIKEPEIVKPIYVAPVIVKEPEPEPIITTIPTKIRMLE